MKLTELYKNIQRKKLINNVYSKYWIYDLEDAIVQDETGTYRKLRVKFFDRSPKSSDRLSDLSLSINGMNITMRNIINDISSQNIKLMYCELQLDVDDNFSNIYISKYTLNQQEEQLSPNYYIQGIIYNGDEGKLNICKDLLGESDFVIAPEYNNMFWYCGCGYANMHDQLNCVHCNRSKAKMIEIADIDKGGLIKKYLPTKFKLNISSSVEEQLTKFINANATKYSISTNTIASLFNVEQLKQKQEKMILEKIVNYINNQPIIFNYEKSFDENINKYISEIETPVVTKSRIIEYIDIAKLRNEYVEGQKTYLVEQKQKQSKQKLMILISVIAAVVLVLAIVIVMFMQNKAKEENTPDGVTVYDTISSREDHYLSLFNYDNTAYNANYYTDYEYYHGYGYKEYVNQYIPDFESFNTENNIESVNDLVDYYRMSDNIDMLSQEPKAIVEQHGNFEFKALDEKTFMVNEIVDIDESTKKVYTYVGDVEGKPLYADKENSYVIRNYKDGNISSEYVYANGSLVRKVSYSYKDNQLTNAKYYRLSDYNDENSWVLVKDAQYQDGVVSKDTSYFLSGKLESETTYKHENKVIASSSTKMFNEYGTQCGTKSIIYKNGFMVEQTINQETSETYKYYYDNNGIFNAMKITRKYSNGDVEEIMWRTFYDFENGYKFEVSFEDDGTGMFKIGTITVATLSNIGYDSYGYGTYDSILNSVDSFSYNQGELYIYNVERIVDGDRVFGQESTFEEESNVEEEIIEEEIIVEEKVEYIKGEQYPIGEYVLRVNNVFVRSGPDNKSYDVLKTDSLVGDTKNDNQAMLAKGTILDIEEIQHTSSGYWGKIKNHDDAWICLYYEGSYKGDREFAGFIE